MLDKIKSWGTYIALVLVSIGGGIIYALLRKNDDLKGKLLQKQADLDMEKVAGKLAQAKRKSDDAEDNFKRARDAFNKLDSEGGDGDGAA